MSTLKIVIAKLMASPQVAEAMPDGSCPFLYAVYGHMVPSITVNRTNEVAEDGLRQSVVVLTCRSRDAMDTELLGEAVIAALDHCIDFQIDDLDDIEFGKGAVDVTYYDEDSEIFVRDMDFVVSW